MSDYSLVLDLAGPQPSERELAWLFHTLNAGRRYNQLESEPVTRDEYFDAVLELINRKHFSDIDERNTFVREMRRRCQSSLMPDAEITWISKRNGRLCAWLWVYLLTNHGLKSRAGFLSEEGRRRDIIRYLDLMSGSTFNKLVFIQELRDCWEVISSSGNSDMKWLNEKDEDQCRWAIEYLDKKRIDLTVPQSVYLPSLFSRVHARIDAWSFSASQRLEFTSKMKQAWRQKQGREDAKGQSEKIKIRLTQKYLIKLGELSQLYEHATPNETLKHLIDKEHRKMTESWLKEKST